jgi:hypothetical protein
MARMVGNAGFAEDVAGLFTDRDRECMQDMAGLDLGNWSDVRKSAREILRRVRLAEGEPDHMPPGRTWPQSYLDALSAWIADDMPKAKGERYSAYFRDLDAVTEYFDVYGHPQNEFLMPKVGKYFGRDSEPGRRKALNIWRAYAIIPDDDPTKAQERQALEQELAHADVASAIRDVDAVLLGLVRKHWSSQNGVDREMMLDALLRFGADRLPDDIDRLNRVKAQNPEDDRLPNAQNHRMDSLIMWMNWMGHVECAVLLDSPQHADHGLRTQLMAALGLGYSADCVFRNRGQTHQEYYGADGESRMWRKSLLLTNDFDKARAEAHVLAQLRETQAGPLLAADVPVRFRTIV